MIPDQINSKILKNLIPITVMLEVTWKCNLKCRHCFQFTPAKNELSTREIENILNQLAKVGAFFLTLTGGEPLVREDIFSIIQMARKKNFVITLYTNGTLINADVAKKISQAGILYVQISLHGATAAVHDSVTGIKGSFAKTMAAVKLLRRNKVRVGLATTLMKPNFHELPQIDKLHAGATDESRISPMVFPANTGGKGPLKLALGSEQIKKFYTFIMRKNERLLEERRIVTGLICGYGRTSCCVNAIGQVYPCVAVPLAAGDLRKDPFDKIWRTSHLLKKIRATGLCDLTECKKCGLAGYCCRCSALAYWETGNLNAAAKSCCQQAQSLKEAISDEKDNQKTQVRKTENDQQKDYCPLL